MGGSSNSETSGVGGRIGAAVGGFAGASIGALGGPVGSRAGGAIGGFVGYYAGDAVESNIINGSADYDNFNAMGDYNGGQRADDR